MGHQFTVDFYHESSVHRVERGNKKITKSSLIQIKRRDSRTLDFAIFLPYFQMIQPAFPRLNMKENDSNESNQPRKP